MPEKDFRVIDFRVAARKFKPDHPTIAPLLSALLPDWLLDRRADNRRPKGIDSYEDKFNQFIAYAGDIPVSEINETLIKNYKRFMTGRLAAGSVRNALTVVRAFCDWCVSEGYLADNPAKRVPHPHVEEPDPDPLSHDQVQTLLDAVSQPFKRCTWTQPRTKRCLVLMLHTGVRISEAAGIRRADINFEHKTLRIRKEVAKNGKARTLPINDVLLAELEACRSYRMTWAIIDQGDRKDLRGVPMTEKSLGHIFERVLPRLIDFHVHAHQLRKTFATELYLNGRDIGTIQRLLGHSDPKTTMRYIGVSAQREHGAVDGLNYGANED